MRIIPPDAVFTAHGLHDVVLDIPQVPPSTSIAAAFQSSEPFDASEWLTGSATLIPTDRYQLLTSHTETQNVRFSFCPALESSLMARFRRQAQLLSLDTVPNAPGPSRRYGRVKEVVAWWEDGHGLWFVVREDVGGEIPFVQSWSTIMGDPDMKDVVNDSEGIPSNYERLNEMDQTTAESVYGELCGLLLKVVECLMALHQRNLSLISARPSTFSIFPGTEETGYETTARLSRFDLIVPLPSHNLRFLLQDTPLASSLLFPRDIVDGSTSAIDEASLRKNLRYLAPETAISKRLSNTSDIYSFGVLAYEMLTGSTIDGGPDSPEETQVDVLIDFHRHVTMEILPPRDWLEKEGALGSFSPSLPPQQLSDIVMRCLGKEPDTRYASLGSLAYDLSKLHRICRTHGNLSKFEIGEVDDMSRFSLPTRPVHREEQINYLKDAMRTVASSSQKQGNPATETCRVINVSGTSGSGKSRIVRQFAIDVEMAGQNPLTIAWAKLEETIHPPLSSFIQIFSGLLDQSLADPDKDVKEWNEKIQQALGGQFHLFVSLLPTEYRRALGIKTDSNHREELDWTALRGTFATWCRSFLQLFATPGRPLVIVIDDIQWMPSDESHYWKLILDGIQPLHNTLLISTCRVQSDNVPPNTSLFVSLSCTNIHIPLLSEDSVLAFVKICFQDRIESGQALASFLFAETGGSSLYLRTLVTTLVKEGVINFHFDRLTWRFDAVQMQKHLSKSGVDKYLEKLILSLPQDVQELLFYVACLPSRGFPIDQVAELVGRSKDEIETCIKAAVSTATLLAPVFNLISFSHDGPKAVAYRLIPPEKAPGIHQRVSQFLRQPLFKQHYLFDAADHALIARELGGSKTNDEDFVALLLEACSHSALATSFHKAQRLITAAEDTIDATGGYKAWLANHRRTYMRFLFVYAEIHCALAQFEPAFAKLYEAIPECKTDGERIRIAAMRVRLKIAAGRLLEAVNLTLQTLKEQGHDEKTMKTRMKGLPRSPEEVNEFEQTLVDGPVEEDDVRVLIMSLLSSAGSSIYYCEPEMRKLCFGLGLSLAMEVRCLHETTAYFCITQGMMMLDLGTMAALMELGKKLLDRFPFSFLTGHARSASAAFAHHLRPWTAIDDEMDTTFDVNVANANYEQGTNALVWHLGAKVLTGTPVPLDIFAAKYGAIQQFISHSGRFIVGILLQYVERVLKRNHPRPWILEGNIVPFSDTEKFKALLMHTAIRNCLALRLAIFYNAPLQDIQAIIAGGRESAAGAVGLVYNVEWIFLVALVDIQSGSLSDETRNTMGTLAANDRSRDFKDRLNLLKAAMAIHERGFDAVQEAETAVEDLNNHDQHALSGLLSYNIAQAILKATSSPRLAGGFYRAAALSYREAQMYGVCDLLRERYPRFCPAAPQIISLPSLTFNFGPTSAPPLRRASLSTLNGTADSVRSSDGSSTMAEKVEVRLTSDEQLDTLALMRSSLALASEQSPSILLCTLLRILCQFLRAEYSAIALFDESDKQNVRLKAAGPFSRIVSYDLKIADEASRTVCPSSLLLHTARTGKTITSLSSTSRFRADPFFHARTPRSLICLPILSQGVQAGAVLLSSNTTSTTQAQWESAKEVVSTLATFAVIITSNVSFTKRLKSEVDQRTKELQNALAAKTVFLSQCSHELRSPLTAVLGMATILEESAGLSAVQKDYLRTIVTSGEDLLGLINNILDHSRLEAGSVTLEHAPFVLRDVVESALDSLAPAAQKKDVEICLTTSFDKDPPGLLGDSFRIKQILLNLLSNAVKFTAHGRVTVRWNWEALEGTKIRISIAVEDTGIGIPAQKMEKLFRSFSQVDESITRSFGGSGLGLIISKDLAKLLGGDCTATSEYGHGSTFMFDIVADRDPNHHVELSRFPQSKSCFVICEEGPWWDMLEANLNLLNCQPVRFIENVSLCLEPGHAKGLDTGESLDFVMVDTDMITKPILKRMRELQPAATFFFLVKSLKLSEVIRDFDITRESIISRPIKFSSLVRAMLPSQPGGDEQTPMPESEEKSKKGMNRGLAKACPLDVLLVDDNTTNLNVGKRILEIFGYKNVMTASDGQQAIDAAEGKTFDVILLDLQMPVVDGFTAQKRIRHSPLAGDPCIVALTANADQATQQMCKDAHFFDYLSKPLNLPKLENILRKVHEYRQNAHINKHRTP